MFTLEHRTMLLVNVNLRKENQGPDDTRLACDLKLLLTAPNDVLSEFDPALKAMFYHRDVNVPHDDMFDGDNPEWLPNLRVPLLANDGIGFNYEGIGYQCRVHNGIAPDSDIVLDGCKVNSIKFDMQEGGSVNVTMRVQAHPTEQDLAKLAGKIQQDVEVTITPPARATPELSIVGDDAPRLAIAF